MDISDGRGRRDRVEEGVEEEDGSGREGACDRAREICMI